MGGKHPLPGPVYIVSQYNGYLIGKTDDDLIAIRKEKEARGCTGWNILNIENNESIGCMGFNFIVHNKHPSKILSCTKNGQVSISEHKQWDGDSGWRIIQQKDNNIYQLISYNGYWLTINHDAQIVMLKKHELKQNNQQYWQLQYISKPEMLQKIPKMEQKEMEITKCQKQENEEIIQTILNRTNKHKNDLVKKPSKHRKSNHVDNDDDNGYAVDYESDQDIEDNKIESYKIRKKKNKRNKQGMDEQMKCLNEILINSMKEISNSIEMMRSDMTRLELKMQKIEENAQMDRDRIKKQLDIIQTMIGSNDYCSIQNRQRVKHWIRNIVGFDKYYTNFIQNGFHSLTSIANINDPQQLNHIGIKIKGHQLQIMAQILQLRQNKNK